MHKTPIVPGATFGLLTVISEAPGHNGKTRVRCRCTCGAPTVAILTTLQSGRTKSCGCLRREVGKIRKGTGHSWRPEYQAWHNMIRRCHWPTSDSYEHYGGRGIVVCNEWRGSFEAFFAYVRERPTPAHMLDRINNNGNYEPGNVRWSTPTEQALNRRSAHIVTHQGESLPATIWAKRIGLHPGTLLRRLALGWDVARALSEPLRLTGHRRHEVKH